MIIAIDGPAGSGKSTIAKMLADRLSLVFLNTGSFYRALTLALLRASGGAHDGRGGDIDIQNEAFIADFASSLDFDYRNGHVCIADEDVDILLRSDAVEACVAQVSAIVAVRHIINNKIRKLSETLSLVCEGRDMTTVVFPDAQYKFYLDASVDARAKRRYNQGTSELSLEQIRQKIEERDQIDRNKKEGSLKIARDAVYLDTSDLTITEVCDMMISKIH